MDGIFLGGIYDSEGPLGQPGIGARETPSGVNPQSVATTPFPTSVDIQLQGAADGPNGVGVMGYQFWRDGQYICLKRTPVFTDDTVQPETTYNYTFAPLDAHLNEGAITAFSVRTPPGPATPTRGGWACGPPAPTGADRASRSTCSAGT